MTIDEKHNQIDQLEQGMWVPITPTTEAEKIVVALNVLNCSFPEPAHTTTLLKVSWLLQTVYKPISATFLFGHPLYHPSA